MNSPAGSTRGVQPGAGIQQAASAGIRLLIVAALTYSAPVAAQQPASDGTYLRPGDMVRLQVGGEPQLSGDFRVTEEGAALLPLLGLVEVAGRPFAEVRSEVRARFQRELIDAAVVVIPVLRIAVLGEVRQPGLLPVDPTMSVAEVIASAGGLTPTADAGKVLLLRDGTVTPIAFDAPGEAWRQPLRSGDQITVGRQSWLRENLGVVLTTSASVIAAVVTSLILGGR